MTNKNATTAEKYQAYNDSCKELRYLAASYDACTLALLWCGVPDDELEEERNLCTKVGPNGLQQGVFNHPKNLCVKAKTQILARAMESNQIKFSRDGGLEGYLKDIGHVAWDRRQITGNSLKSFLMEYYPQEKPSFLFNEFERGINENITIESYQTLEAERDALKVRLDKAAEVWRNQKERIEELEEKVSTYERQENQSSKLAEEINPRREANLMRIIGALFETVLQAGEYENQTELITYLDKQYKGYGGLSGSNLNRLIPEAKKLLEQP
ncbi:hypothetical protein RP300_00284 [Oligella urethralis]|uniref:hypothetical protein n=1 Tax=Oligella urethralis TaxID=90245 RepID=UPI000DFC4C9E|nr:hypothetical protein [Oligella urethralis]WOS36754.1 hypothetical protein RP300_00284 [Oligella urethralis]SUA62991.1 Uncharacterised protein [Oligella urethralis]